MKMASRRTARSLDRVGSDPAQLDERFRRSQSDPRERKSRDVGTGSLPPIESGDVFSKGTAQNGPCGPGINVYGVMLGATADETILLGLQMIKKMKLTCPSIQQEPQPIYSEEVMTEDDQLQEEKHFSEEESSEDIEEEESGDDKLENEISKTTYPSVNPSRVTQDSGIESRRGTNESTFKSMIKEENAEEEEELEEEEPSKVESQSNTTRSDESQKETIEDVEEEEEPVPIVKQESYRPSPQSSNSSKRSSSQKSSRHSQSSSQDRSTSQVKNSTSSQEVVREVQSIGRLSDTGSKQTTPKTSTKSSSSDSSPSTCVRKQESKTSRSSSSGGSEDVKLQLSRSQKDATKPRSSSSILKGSSSSSKSRSDPENVSCSCTCSNSTPEKGEKKESSSSCSCCSCVKRKVVVCPVQKSCFKASSKVCGICAPSSNRTCYGSKSDLEMVKNCSQKKVRMCCDCSTSTSSCLASSISEKSKQMQIGDGLQGKVRYSITKITDYGEFTTFEVMKSTKKTPKTMPSSLEGVFVLRKAKSKA